MGNKEIGKLGNFIECLEHLRKVFFYEENFNFCGDFFCVDISIFASGQIYISQIQITGGKNNTGNDFIEFFNAISSPVNLKGCHLVKRPGDADSDTLVKSWSRDAFIPAKSFYLWANSGYTSIGAKPDVVSSATISENSGVALRFGSVNTGKILDAVSWGKTGNEFKNVSLLNPLANQGLIRKDLYQDPSAYAISASVPRNSLVNDLAAAFMASQETDAVIKNNPDEPPEKDLPSAAKKSSEDSSVKTPPADNIIAQAGEESAGGIPTSSANSYPTQTYSVNQDSKQGAIKYLILSGAALFLLLGIAWRFLFSKKNKKII